MKAVLLAAGLGTRLLPLTKDTPKCLIPINGLPLMEYWFRLFRKSGIDEVLINLNHLPEKVKAWVDEHSDGLKVRLVYEEHLLGSWGTILNNRQFFEADEDTYIFYSDNLTNIDLKKMYQFHKSSESVFTMGLFHTNNPKACGIAELDKNFTVTSFVEKPLNPKSDLANAGIYLMTPSVFGLLPQFENIPEPVSDIGYHLLPKLVNTMKGYPVRKFLLDIGTLENLNFANKFVENNPDLFK